MYFNELVPFGPHVEEFPTSLTSPREVRLKLAPGLASFNKRILDTIPHVMLVQHQHDVTCTRVTQRDLSDLY